MRQAMWFVTKLREAGRRTWRLGTAALAAGSLVFGATSCGDDPTGPGGTLIGPEGGIVTSSDGLVTLEIPAGALTASTSIVIVPIDDTPYRSDPLYVKATAYEVQPRSLQLREHAHLRVRYDPANVPAGVEPSRLRIMEREQAQNRWEEMVHVGLDAGGIQAELEHACAFAVVAQPITVASLTVSPTALTVEEGSSVQMTAEARDAAGNVLNLAFTWRSSNAAVASVSASGLVTGVAAGTATITASVGLLDASGTATVHERVGSIVIADIGREPLEVGLTRQLSATVYGPTGLPVQAPIAWTSSNAAVATVDPVGLVTGAGPGTAVITASAGTKSATVSIRVVGESEEAGNNMAWPTVFADGVGLTGFPVATDPGVRPTAAEGITPDALPFFYDGNVPDYQGVYYLQQGPNTWRAEWLDGTGQPAYSASAYWGDNITVKEWSASKPVRVEVALTATGVGTMTGYVMTYLYGDGPSEMQGTDGATAEFAPLMYTVGPTIIVEKLDAQGGTVTAEVVNEPIKAEVNVGGRIIYGYQLNLGASGEGWYRLRFRLAAGANVAINAVGNASGMFMPVVVSPSETALEVRVTP